MGDAGERWSGHHEPILERLPDRGTVNTRVTAQRLTRAERVRLLAAERDPASLGAHLRDRAWQIRWEAIKSLAKTRSPASEPYLLDVLREPLDVHDLPFANAALGEVGTTAAIPALAALIHHPTEDVKTSAIHALMMLGDSSLTMVFLDALGDRSGVARSYAMEALDRHGDKRAVAAVVGRVRDMLARDRRQVSGGWTELMHALAFLDRWQVADGEARLAIVSVASRWARLSDAERRWYAATFPGQV